MIHIFLPQNCLPCLTFCDCEVCVFEFVPLGTPRSGRDSRRSMFFLDACILAGALLSQCHLHFASSLLFRRHRLHKKNLWLVQQKRPIFGCLFGLALLRLLSFARWQSSMAFLAAALSPMILWETALSVFFGGGLGRAPGDTVLSISKAPGDPHVLGQNPWSPESI